MDLSVVIPTFNEKENILILIPKLEIELKKNKIDFEIIIVDDNSPDGTGQAAIELNKKYNNIVVVVRKKAKGIASAWYHGYRIARGNFIGTMDADLCHSPADLVKMYKQVPRADFVIGSRYLGKTGRMKDKSIAHLFASWLGQYVIKLTMGLDQTDITHSFRIFRKEVFHDIKKDVRTSGNVFLVLFLYLAVNRGYKTKEVPIKYGKRLHGQTKLKLYKESARFIYHAARIYLTR